MGADPWRNVSPVPPVGCVSLVEGSTFIISDARGDVLPGAARGLFHRDTRFLSRLELRVDGANLEPLAARAVDPYSARFVLRVPREGPAESPLVAVRNRFVGQGLHEDLDVTNHGLEPVTLTVEYVIDADFADLFEVKALGAGGKPGVLRRVLPAEGVLELEYARDGFRRASEVRLSARPEEMTESGARFRVSLGAGETWHTCVEVCLNLDEERCLPRCRCDAFGTLPVPLARRAADWRRRFPEVRSGSDALNHLYRQSVDDLAALLMPDPDGAGDLVVAAGLPWFMTLFGRDAILTALAVLPFDRELPAGVLRTLARHQGRERDEDSEEAPGKILHELRFGELARRGRRTAYYATVDATPLFVSLVAEAWRWGLPWEEVEPLLGAVRRALTWMREFGDLDGDGYLEYPGRTDSRGLRNQGWKDSWDAIQFADGRMAEGPIALCEVQGYRYRALLDAAELLSTVGAPEEARRCREEAAALAEGFRRDFWMPGETFPALALDGRKRPVDALASNAGHVLWSGILSREQEVAVAARLLDPDLFSGWGLRTLATSNRGYRPVSYHAGSVWPHDTAIAVAGLARAGFVAEAQTLARGLLDAAPHFGYRLPELFSGFDRERFGFPVGYPTASSPQAWAAASVLLLLRALLGLRPDLPGGRLEFRPTVPPELLPLRVEGWWVGGGRLSVEVGPAGSLRLLEVPAGLEVDLVSSPEGPPGAAGDSLGPPPATN